MKKFAVGLITTMLLTVVIGGGVILANDGKAKVRESVSLSARTFSGGGCDALHTCFLSGFPQELILDGQAQPLKGFVHLTSVKGGEIDNAVTITVTSIAISKGSGTKVATLTGGVPGFSGDWDISPFFTDATIVADEAARTIVLTLDTFTGTKTFTFSGNSPGGFPYAVVDISQ